MPRFVLIDHSLKGVGGHHYEYALHVARAAEAAGYLPVLATHRRFSDRGLMGSTWQLFTPYRQSTYSEHAILGNLPKWNARRRPQPAAVARRTVPRRVLERLRQWRADLVEWRRLREGASRSFAFEHGTRELFRWLVLAPGDQVFIPTLNELDLDGLLHYLRSEPASQVADWHLQFHYDIDPEGDASCRKDGYRRRLHHIFGQCRDLLSSHRLHFYTTTGQLAQQYNQLGTVHFRGLPYPVNPAFQKTHPATKSPLVATCLGGVRDEKGLQSLSGIFDELWSEYFESSRLRLVMQAERTKKLPGAIRRRLGRSAHESIAGAPIRVVPHPLNSEAYVRLLQESDIGLLLYDRKQYLNRCSGVLVELLTAGVPVIVPAGCWLADQLAEEVHRHHETIGQRLPRVESISHAGPELSVPASATHLLATFRWSSPDTAATNIRLQVRQSDENGNPLRYEHCIAGHRSAGRPATALVELTRGAKRLRLDWQAAYRDAAVSVRDVRIDFLSAADEPGHTCPLGAVGLIAAEPGHVPRLLRNMVDHYGHYRQTAAEFARRWIEWHNPDRVVAELLATTRSCAMLEPAVA